MGYLYKVWMCKKKADKRFSSSIGEGKWVVSITACPALFRHGFTPAQVNLINENILCLSTLAKVEFRMTEISFAYLACFASIPQLPEMPKERSTE